MKYIDEKGRKDYRTMLADIGGWNNEMVSVNAGVVKEIIEELYNLRDTKDARDKDNG